MPTDTSTDLVSEFYPLTREQLEIPAIPLLRLGPLGQEVAAAVSGRTEPHFQTRQAGAKSFTVAARAAAPIPDSSPPVEPSDRLPDVRFAVSSTGLSDLEMPASTASVRVAAASQMADAQLGLEQEAKMLAATYPYWMTALVQIAIGTLIVILLMKFANLVRDSFGVKHPVSASATLAGQEESDEPLHSVQPIKSTVCETEQWL